MKKIIIAKSDFKDEGLTEDHPFEKIAREIGVPFYLNVERLTFWAKEATVDYFEEKSMTVKL